MVAPGKDALSARCLRIESAARRLNELPADGCRDSARASDHDCTLGIKVQSCCSSDTPPPLSRVFMLVQDGRGVSSLLRRQASQAEWCYCMRPPSDRDGLAHLISASAAFVARTRALLPAVEHTMRGGMLSIWTSYGT